MAEQMYELQRDVSQNHRLYNKDLAPIEIKRRTWGTYNFAALWIGMAHCVPTYLLAGGLIALGMDWKQALFTITLGNLIVLIPMLLNAHPGTKYGIPFPVFARASFGVFGANIPALLRAIVACGWFGINTYIGSLAIDIFFGKLIPGWSSIGGTLTFAFGMTVHGAIAFMIFWIFQIYIILRGMDAVRIFENWAAPFVILLGLALVIWMITAAKGFGPLLAQPSKFHTFGEYFKVFIPALTGMVGFWATLSLNIPDFTRFGKGQKQQMIGQAIGLPPTMLVFSAFGVVITSASAIVFGEAIWDPAVLLGQIQQPHHVDPGACWSGGRVSVGEHCRQYGVSGERLLEHHPEAHQLQDGWSDHGDNRNPDHALETACGPERIHLRMARNVLGLPWADRWSPDCRLLGHSEDAPQPG